MVAWAEVSPTLKTAAQNGFHRKPACRINYKQPEPSPTELNPPENSLHAARVH